MSMFGNLHLCEQTGRYEAFPCSRFMRMVYVFMFSLSTRVPSYLQQIYITSCRACPFLNYICRRSVLSMTSIERVVVYPLCVVVGETWLTQYVAPCHANRTYQH